MAEGESARSIMNSYEETKELIRSRMGSRFNRLPTEIQRKVVNEELKKEKSHRGYSKKLLKRHLIATLSGGIVFLIIGMIMGEPSLLFLVLITAAGSAGSCLVSVRQRGAISATVLVGGTGVAIAAIGYLTEILVVSKDMCHLLFFMMSWIGFICFGGFLGMWLDGEV